jgi:CubicO group peptidase (beta-lactamase class C family)
VTNKDFAKLLKEKIFEPLGMNNSGYCSQETIQQNFATGYLQKENGFLNAPYWDTSQSFSAAGVYSTVGDLFKWDRALRKPELISERGLRTVFTPYSEKIRYGLGWFINDPEINGAKRLFAGHTGGASGYKSGIMRGINDATKCIINGGVQCKFVVYFSKCVWFRGTVTRFEFPPLLMHKR